MYWLSLIASVTGIISFVLSFIEKFKNWKPYFLYFSSLMVGLTIGVIISMSESAMKQFTSGQLFYLIALISLLSFSVFFMYKFLTKVNEAMFVIIIVLLIVFNFMPSLLDSIDRSQNFLKPADYSILSNYYQKNNDYIRAADYLQRYKELDGNNLTLAMEDSIKKKINYLRSQAINSR